MYLLKLHLSSPSIQTLLQPPEAATLVPTAASDLPLVSIVIAHRNRPALLGAALSSVELQTYPNIEVVLVDDGSDEEPALQYLDELADYFRERQWKLVFSENNFLGAARNLGTVKVTSPL